MSFVQPVRREDVALRIDEETKLVSQLVVTLMSNGVDNPYPIAFSVLDRVMKEQEIRYEIRLQAEYKRRRGY